MSFNQVDGVLSYSEVADTLDSRIEEIGLHESTWEHVESLLLQAIEIS